jgi:hypothetical protein
MESSEIVEHSRTKYFQIWNVHTLAIYEFNQITILAIIWILKMILD